MAIERISIEINSNAKDIQKQLSDVDSRLQSLKNSRAEISLKADKLADARKQIKEIDVELAKLKAQKAQLQVDATKTDEAKKKLDEIEKSMRSLKAQKAALQVDTTQLKGSDTQLKSIDREMRQLNNRKARLQVESEDAAEAESGLGRLRSKLSEINSSRTNVNISSNIEQVGSALNNMSNKIFGLFNPLKSMLGQWIGIGAAVNLVNKGINMVTGSLSGAVERYDTMNNFPNVMANLGIAAEDAQAAINEIAAGLKGLPTALDAGARSVQRFTAKNNNIKRSTQMFLAMNNAILAGGQSAQIQESAIEQLSQAYSKGRMDMNEWNSLQTAMSAQLNQVAKAMGLSTDALGEGLRTGTIAMDDFMDSIIRLNDEGVDGFASFAEQARSATGGISTSIENMKSAIKRGWISIFEAINGVFEGAGLGGISGVFGKIGEAIESVMSKIGDVIRDNEDVITGFIDRVRNFDWAALWEGFKEGFTELKEAAKSLVETLQPVIDFFKNAITNLGDGSFAKGLGKLPALLFKVAAALKVVGAALKVLGKLSNFNMPGFGSKEGGGVAFNFDFGQMLNQVKNLALVFAAIKIIEEVAQAMQDINEKVPEDTLVLAHKVANMTAVLAVMGGLVVAAGKLAQHNTKAALLGMAAIAGISGNLILAAEALKQVSSKVPADVATLALKVANMAIALGAMGVLVAAAGVLAKSNLAAAALGLIAVAALSLELMLVAEAIRQLDEKVPSDVASIALKVANIAIVIGAMGLLAGVLGVVMATGIGAAIITLGIVAIVELAVGLMAIVEAIRHLDESVPSNFDSVSGKIDTIAKVIQAFTDAGFGNIFDTFTNMFAAININSVASGLNGMVRIAERLEKLGKIKIPANATKKIQDLKKVIAEITKGNDFFEGLKSIAANAVNSIDMSIVIGMLDKMIFLSNQLKELDENTADLDVDDIIEKIGSVKEIIDAISSDTGFFENLKSLMANTIESIDISVISGMLNKMIELSEKITDFTAKTQDIDFEDVEAKIGQVKSVLEVLSSDNSFWEGVSQLASNIVEAMDVVVLTSMIVNYGHIIDAIDDLRIDEELDVDKITTKIGEIRDVLDALVTEDEEGFWDKVSSAASHFVEAMDIALLTSMITNYANVVAQVERLSALMETADESGATVSNFDKEAIIEKIQGIREILDELSSEDGFFANIWSAFENFTSNMNDDQVYAALGFMIAMAEQINDFVEKTEDLNVTLTNGQIRKIRGVMQTIEEEKGFFETLGNSLSGFGTDENRDKILAAMDVLNSIADRVAELNKKTIDEEKVTATIQAVSAALKELEAVVTLSDDKEEELKASAQGVKELNRIVDIFSGLGAITLDIDAITTTIDNAADIITLLDDFPSSEGELSVKGLAKSFVDLVDTLSMLADELLPIGLNYGEQLVQGFVNAEVPSNIISRIEGVIANMRAKTSVFFNIGLSFGQRLVAGFQSGISNMANTIASQISQIQTSLNSVSVPSPTTTGGTAPVYRASGGLIGNFRARGTDTVPAMLTPGEFVQSKRAVNTFGREFMNRVNHGDIAGVFKAMTGRFGAPYMEGGGSVVNNVSHSNTNNARVTQNIVGGNPDYAFRRAERYVRVRS